MIWFVRGPGYRVLKTEQKDTGTSGTNNHLRYTLSIIVLEVNQVYPSEHLHYNSPLVTNILSISINTEAYSLLSVDHFPYHT